MSRSPVSLRSFHLADATVVAPWLEGPGLGLPPGTAGGKWAERLLADRRVQAWVALLQGQPIGFARLDTGPDRVAELTLAIAAPFRRQGLGTGVLELVVAQAQRRRLRRVQAMVDSANAPALAFFREAGFDEAGGVGDVRRFVRWIHETDPQALEI